MSLYVSDSKWDTFVCSTFSDVFDELHFINMLQQDVVIVKELPKELESVPRARKHFTSWSVVSYYEEMRQLWKDYQASFSSSICYLPPKYAQSRSTNSYIILQL